MKAHSHSSRSRGPRHRRGGDRADKAAPAATTPPAAAAPAAAPPAAATRGAAQQALRAATAAPAAAPADAKTGDVAWMLTSTALVLMMSVPALALFYGGMVRSKEHAVDADAGVRGVLAGRGAVCLYGYSLAFTEGNQFFGDSTEYSSRDVRSAEGEFAPQPRSPRVVIPELVYVAFQATFAASPAA